MKKQQKRNEVTTTHNEETTQHDVVTTTHNDETTQNNTKQPHKKVLAFHSFSCLKLPSKQFYILMERKVTVSKFN